MSDDGDIVNNFLAQYEEVHTEADSTTQHQNRTRNHVTRLILWFFVLMMACFTLSICGIVIWGEPYRAVLLLEMATTIISIVTPIVTFILGYYYATKAAN